jgi:chemotaxis protein MotB
MSDAGNHPEIIIIRRHDDDEHEHHSSAWKVAHADFMTAMMAFFLIMWLINVTDEEVKKGISEYFNPLHITEGQTEHKGLNDPDAAKAAEDGEPGKAPPQQASGGTDAEPVDEHAATPVEEHAAATAEAGGGAGADAEAPSGAPEAMPGDPSSEKIASGDLATVGPAEEATMDDRERAAFQDPYALLASLATEYEASHPASADITVGDVRNEGLPGGEADRDPFDPIYWQTAQVPDVRASEPGAPGTAEAILPDVKMDAAGAEPSPVSATGEPAAPLPIAAPAEPLPVVEIPTVADAGVDAVTMAIATDVGKELNAGLQEALGNTPAPGVNVTATSEGVLIDLLDQENYSMFEIGSAIPDAKVVVILEQVAKVLANRSGEIAVRGHTDGRPFRSPDYDNWRLSAARAHMAYYMLVRGGLQELRVQRIEGFADRRLKNSDSPNAAENRRIEILLSEATP